jgi:hypothetical protein
MLHFDGGFPAAWPQERRTVRKIGRYEVRRILCKGTTPLLEAVDPTLGRSVMIRALSHTLAVDPDRRTRFLDAAMLAARLTSPRIASVLDLGEDNGAPYVVMRLPDGPSLRSVMDEAEPRPAALRVDVISQLCEALAHAHRRGLFQVGLRPTGIFLSDEGRVTVVPFGTVPIHGSGGTLAALSLEDVAYLAPELVDSRVPDRRADIFTLGVIAYELMARRRPFEGANIPALLHALVKERPDAAALERGPHDPALEAVILKALASDPSDRYPEAGVMLVDLEDLVCEAPLATDTSTPDGARSDPRRFAAGVCPQDESRARQQPPAVVAGGGDAAPGEGAPVDGRRHEAEGEMFRAKALSCAAEGRFDEAQALLTTIESREPGDPRNALLRAYLHEEATTEALLEVACRQVEVGNLRAARAAAGEALALDPARVQARALVRQLDRILFVAGDGCAPLCPPEAPRN